MRVRVTGFILALASWSAPVVAAAPEEVSTVVGGASDLALPALPAGVEELHFSDLFKPIGRYGLELTERVQQLDGKRVRILGFMVLRDDAPPGTLLLTRMPVHLHEHEYGLADDLPAATLWVDVPASATAAVPYTPGPLLLTGMLHLGPRSESDGRTSHVRLTLDETEPIARDSRGATAAATDSNASSNAGSTQP